MMNAKQYNGSLWDIAGLYALFLGIFPMSMILLNSAVVSMMADKNSANFYSTIIWGCKVTGCIAFFMFSMKKSGKFADVSDKNFFKKFGLKLSVLSSILYTALYSVYYSLCKDKIMEAYYAVLNENKLDAGASEAVLKLLSGPFVIISTWIYCVIFGIILTYISINFLNSGVKEKINNGNREQ